MTDLGKENGVSRPKASVLSSVLAAAVLLLGAVAPGQAQFGKNKIRYGDFDWQIYHSPHFDVYYYSAGEPLLQKIVSFAESAYDQLSQDLNFKIEEPIPLIYYVTHSDFEQNNIILNFIPEGVGAFASPVRNRMVLPVDLPGPELLQLVLHELTHIFQYEMLFGGNLSKGVASAPPTWFMEGMASYMAQDESARDKMYLRDAVVNDRIPPVTANFGGFFAYRFGHAVFEYIEEEYGKEGVRDFIIETRNTLGGRVGRAVERSFGVDAEDFNAEFRRWLRRRYLPEFIETGEPGDFGRRFRRREGPRSLQASPAASPSGDLLVAFSTTGTAYSNPTAPQVDVLLYDARKREVIRNLTKGFDRSDFQYFIAQELTLGRKMGRDISFSPDGDRVAFFVRRERGRSLVLLNVLNGKIEKVLDMDVEQQTSPAFSADGRTVAFGGHRGGQFDIFTIELESGVVRNLTSDAIFDAAPVYSPDGKSLVMTSVVGGYAKLFRVDLDRPSERFPLTQGETNETDATYSPDGKRLYYTSDRTGADNIYSLELETGKVVQHTNSVTGCFMPTVLANPEGDEKLVFTSLWQGLFDLYLLETDEPITDPIILTETTEGEAPQSLALDELARFEPSIEVTIDDRNKDDYGGRKFFIEDAGGTVGLSDDQTFIGVSYIQFSDFLGDRRIIGQFQSIESFQNFDLIYANFKRRWQWQVHLFDDRDFFIGVDQSTGFLERGRALFAQTGAIGTLIFPWNVSHRFELGLGYIYREYDQQTFRFQPDGTIVPAIVTITDDFPLVRSALVGDTIVATPWGIMGGRRWRLQGTYAPDLDESGTLSQSLSLDYRQYIPLARRTNLSFRFFGYSASGNRPGVVYFGGLDTLRGYDFRSIVGDNGFFTNLELRFPLFDQLATPVLNFGAVRGVIFVDIGGAWFDEFEDFDLWNSAENRLEDAVASYGYGVSIDWGGLSLNIDFAKRWDLDRTLSGYESSFWIGTRF
jgi:Tol biopolymer transport system component